MLKAYGGLAAQIVTPVFVDGRLLAILSLHELRAPRQWTQEESTSRPRPPSGCATSCDDRRGARAQPLASGLEPVAAVAPGAEMTFETRDGIDGQLTAGSRHEAADFGVTPLIPGFGFVADLFLDPYVAKWTIADGTRGHTQELPGVAVPAAVFAGVAGGTAFRRLTVAAARRADRNPAITGLRASVSPKINGVSCDDGGSGKSPYVGVNLEQSAGFGR